MKDNKKKNMAKKMKHGATRGPVMITGRIPKSWSKLLPETERTRKDRYWDALHKKSNGSQYGMGGDKNIFPKK